jgi:formate dehydrogenase iron-sulfur subunit
MTPLPLDALLNRDGGPTLAGLDAGVRYGFFTDTSICIGCKACEVACKEWNAVPEARRAFTGNSMDNTGALGANAWRHVAFIEQSRAPQEPGGAGGTGPPQEPGGAGPRQEPVFADLTWFGDEPQALIPDFNGVAAAPDQDFRWLMASDVCKHCTEAACLEVCPTGAIFYTEYRTVVVQDDVCNGCGYCVTACPYGVIERREADGGAWKCTLCYDRMKGGKQPACAMACPTDSIQFGPLDHLRERADARVGELQEAGHPARLYGRDEDDGVSGNGAFFLLLDDPEVYRLPPDPVTPTRNLKAMWTSAGKAAALLAVGVVAAFMGGTSRR